MIEPQVISDSFRPVAEFKTIFPDFPNDLFRNLSRRSMRSPAFFLKRSDLEIGIPKTFPPTIVITRRTVTEDATALSNLSSFNHIQKQLEFFSDLGIATKPCPILHFGI